MGQKEEKKGKPPKKRERKGTEKKRERIGVENMEGEKLRLNDFS